MKKSNLQIHQNSISTVLIENTAERLLGMLKITFDSPETQYTESFLYLILIDIYRYKRGYPGEIIKK